MVGQKLKILIVDDEPLARNRLRALCDRYEHVGQIFVAEGGEDALTQIEALKPHAILLDVDMPDLSGMDVANICRGMDTVPDIVFTTAHSGYAVDAFRLDATDYLLKPIKMPLLVEALDKVLARMKSRDARTDEHIDCRLWVRDGESSIQIQAMDIERIEAERDYMRLCLPGRNLLLYGSMHSLQEKLPEEMFIRVHRSMIIRRDIIQEVRRKGRRHYAVLADDSKVAVGPLYLDDVAISLIK